MLFDKARRCKRQQKIVIKLQQKNTDKNRINRKHVLHLDSSTIHSMSLHLNIIYKSDRCSL